MYNQRQRGWTEVALTRHTVSTLPYLTLPYLTLPYLTFLLLTDQTSYLTLPYLTLPSCYSLTRPATLPYLTLPYLTFLRLTDHTREQTAITTHDLLVNCPSVCRKCIFPFQCIENYVRERERERERHTHTHTYTYCSGNVFIVYFSSPVLFNPFNFTLFLVHSIYILTRR